MEDIIREISSIESITSYILLHNFAGSCTAVVMDMGETTFTKVYCSSECMALSSWSKTELICLIYPRRNEKFIG